MDLRQTIDQRFFEVRLLTLAERYLGPHGWLQGEPRNGAGEPVPWITYPALDFLTDILAKDWKVLEFGSGFSTLFFNARCAVVSTVEHDPAWANRIRGMNPKASIEVRGEGSPPLPEALPHHSRFLEQRFELPLSPNHAQNMEQGMINDCFLGYASVAFAAPKGTYDLIVVDGVARSLCLYFAARQVRDDGWIILDNSDRWQYNALQKYLISEGFGRLDFYGPGPCNVYGWCTSFFSRSVRLRNQKPERERGAGDLGW